MVAASDAFLAGHNSLSWSGLSLLQKGTVLAWTAKLDSYNNGNEGPVHCGGGGNGDDDCRDGKGKKDGMYSRGGGDDCDDDRDDDHHHDEDDGDKCRGDHKYRDGKGSGWR